MPEEPTTLLCDLFPTELPRNDGVLAQIDLHRKSRWANLPPREKTFVFCWVEHGNERIVANELKMDQRSVRKMLLDPVVRAAISDFQEYVFSQSLVNRGTIERDALEILSMAMGRTDTPMVDKEGDEFSAPVANLSVAKAVLEFLGREHGYGNSTNLNVIPHVTLAPLDADL